MQVEWVKEPEVDKAKDSGVELNKDGHQAHVHTGRLRKAKAVWHNPGHRLTFYLSLEMAKYSFQELKHPDLEIVAFDAAKDDYYGVFTLSGNCSILSKIVFFLLTPIKLMDHNQWQLLTVSKDFILCQSWCTIMSVLVIITQLFCEIWRWR